MYTYLDYILYILMSLNFDSDFRSFSKPSTKNQYQNSIPFVKQTSQVVIFPKKSIGLNKSTAVVCILGFDIVPVQDGSGRSCAQWRRAVRMGRQETGASCYTAIMISLVKICKKPLSLKVGCFASCILFKNLFDVSLTCALLCLSIQKGSISSKSGVIFEATAAPPPFFVDTSGAGDATSNEVSNVRKPQQKMLVQTIIM